MMTPARIIVAAVSALILLGLILLGPVACSKLQTAKKQLEVSEGQAGATLDSADVANMTEAEREVLADAIEAEAEKLAEEVRNAPPGDSNDEATKAACQLKSYRDTPECVALRETPDAP